MTLLNKSNSGAADRSYSSNSTTSPTLHFKHARVALSAGSIEEAIIVANGYLVQVGREGKFYREALEAIAGGGADGAA